MLTKFAVKNYRGFADRIEWDLSHPGKYDFNTYAIKDDIIKNGIIYGPNGCGKSNFALALFDIENHLSQKWKKQDYYFNYVYAGKPNAPVEFEYNFIFNSKTVIYKYSKDLRGALLTESLAVDGKDIFVKTINTFSIDRQQFPMDEAIIKNLKANANKVSIVNFLLTSYPLSKDSYLIQLQNFANGMLWFKNLDSREFIGLDTTISNIEEYFIKNNLIDDFENFIEKVSEQKFRFVKPKLEDKFLSCYIDDMPVAFNPIISTGTEALKLLFFWIKKMDKASFVFIDEFDAFYHFKLSFEVCKQLFNLKCQVFTSSHNTYLMTNDLLRPDCNFIISNNKIKALCNCTAKELRFGHNIEKMFRGNAFNIE